LNKEKFNQITKKYGLWSSWSIWAEQEITPKSGIGDLSVFENEINIELLKPNIVLVGLNISRGAIKEPLANFHDKRSEATDFKIRYAFKNTPYWGAYMTDLIKDYDQKDSGKVIKHLRSSPEIVQENIEILNEELFELDEKKIKLIAFGRDVYSLLKKNYKDKYEILKIPHYASYTSKERYRELVNISLQIN
jgi:hypothetical protein